MTATPCWSWSTPSRSRWPRARRRAVCGTRWDGALLGLGLFLGGEAVGDPVAAANSPEAQEFSKQSVQAWAEVVKDSGTATDEELAAATEVSLAQFAPESAPG